VQFVRRVIDDQIERTVELRAGDRCETLPIRLVCSPVRLEPLIGLFPCDVVPKRRAVLAVEEVDGDQLVRLEVLEPEGGAAAVPDPELEDRPRFDFVGGEEAVLAE
jgi:hypothetical protein